MRMTTKLRHPHIAPLRTINSQSSFFSRTNTIAKRKSAVQILQETKAFYVKSETVLDKKQEFRPGKVSVSESPYRSFSQNESQKENKLEDKLRVLLNFDSLEGSGDSRKESGKEGRIRNGGTLDKNSCFQHKSLPDLSMTPHAFSSESSDSSFDIKCDGDTRSAYSSRTQPETRRPFAEKCVDCRRFTRSSKNFCSPEFRNHARIYCSFRATKSGEFMEPKLIESESSRRRRSSNTSSCNRSRHNSSSKHSQSADSGRQSQGGSVGLRTGRSGLPEFPSPPSSSSWTDSGTEDDSPPLFRVDSCEGDRKRPILRSKSDISYKYCARLPNLGSTSVALPTHSSPPTTEKLETFFDHLGMDPMDFKELASSSRNSSPVFFSSVSSIDSCVDLTGWTLPEPYKVTECPSIVERNARIIKWLYNCRKFQKAVVNEVFQDQTPCMSHRRLGPQSLCRVYLKPLTGKFYARHDFTDPNLIDPDLEQTIIKKKMALSKDKFKEPLTGNMEYGWYVRPRVMRSRFNFYFPKSSSQITKVGAMIASEDEKMPKKPFTGIAFKV